MVSGLGTLRGCVDAGCRPGRGDRGASDESRRRLCCRRPTTCIRGWVDLPDCGVAGHCRGGDRDCVVPSKADPPIHTGSVPLVFSGCFGRDRKRAGMVPWLVDRDEGRLCARILMVGVRNDCADGGFWHCGLRWCARTSWERADPIYLDYAGRVCRKWKAVVRSRALRARDAL